VRNMSPSSGNMEATSRRLSSIQSLAAVTNVEPMHHRCVFALRESPVSATLGAKAVNVECVEPVNRRTAPWRTAAPSLPRRSTRSLQDPILKKTGTGDVTIAGLQSAAGLQSQVCNHAASKNLREIPAAIKNTSAPATRRRRVVTNVEPMNMSPGWAGL
jgi:hypothetical protein